LPTPAVELRFGNDAKTLGWAVLAGDPTRSLRWRIDEPVAVHEIDTRDDTPSRIPWAAFHPTAPLLAVASADGVVLVDARRHVRLGQLPARGPRRLSFLDDGRLLVLERGEEGCRMFPVSTLPHEIHIGKAEVLRIAAPVREADCVNGRLCIWDGT